MAGQRQPIELVVAKGNKHLTKAEIEERRNGIMGTYIAGFGGISIETIKFIKRYTMVRELSRRRLYP